MSRARRGVVVGAVALLAACWSAFAPEDRLEVFLTVSPTIVDLGDTVHLTGLAYNPTSVTVDAGAGCSPGIGFYVARDGAEERSVYSGEFLCPLRDNNRIEPGETDAEAFPWVPDQVGSYRVRAAVITDAGPRSPSRAETVVVR
jgi:hypothetical protein